MPLHSLFLPASVSLSVSAYSDIYVLSGACFSFAMPARHCTSAARYGYPGLQRYKAGISPCVIVPDCLEQP